MQHLNWAYQKILGQGQNDIYTLDLQVIKNNLNPSWRPFEIKAQRLCAGDVEKQIKVIIFIDFGFCICFVDIALIKSGSQRCAVATR